MASYVSSMFKAFSSGLTVGKSASADLHKFMDCFQPLAEKTDAAQELRKAAFRAADPNGNGLCSLAELDTWVMSVLMAKFPKKKDKEPGKDLWTAFRPSYIKAFNDAKDYSHDDGTTIGGTKNAKQDDFVSKGEFRLFCAYLCIYASMYDAFAKIDGGGEGREGDDRKIDMTEWMSGYKGVKEHGFAALANLKNDKEAKSTFDMIDENKGGQIMLDEWCDFLKKYEIDKKTKLGETLAEDESAEEASARKSKIKKGGGKSGGGGGGGGSSKGGGKGGSKSSSVKTDFGIDVSGASTELVNFINIFKEYAGTSKEAEAKRKEGWTLADQNGNGLASLAETETFLLKVLVAKYPKTGKGKAMKEPGKDIWDCFRPCYIRAFKDAADYEKDMGEKIKGTKNAKQDDYVSEKEFRLFCTYACAYAAMYDAFAKIDGGSAGRDANDDKRIEKEEFLKGFKGVTTYGFKALENISKKKEAEKAFEKMDDNGGGIVLLDEWCEFIKAAEIEAGTALGKCLAEDEEGGVGKKWSAPKAKKNAIGKDGKPLKKKSSSSLKVKEGKK